MLETYYNQNIQKSKFLYFFEYFMNVFLKYSSCIFSHNRTGTKIKLLKVIFSLYGFLKQMISDTNKIYDSPLKYHKDDGFTVSLGYDCPIEL